MGSPARCCVNEWAKVMGLLIKAESALGLSFGVRVLC